MIVKNIDIHLLYDIFNRYKKDYYPIISDFTNIYAYMLDDDIVAFIIFDIIYEKCQIIDVYVDDNNRRKGIAKKLIKEIEEDFNIENISLEVSSKNKIALNLYETLGFKNVATRKNYYKDSDAILMVKEIR